jgi:branched-chain amino acid transport system ATP-binding protein
VTEVLLDLRHLVAGHDGVPVVHDLDLTVGAGEVVALVGANGAGKTTTLLTVSGLLAPLGGTVEVLGSAVHRRRRRSVAGVWGLARQGLAHVPEDRGLFFDLTAAENLRLGRRRSGRVADGRGGGHRVRASTSAPCWGGSRPWPPCSIGGPGCSRGASSRCWPWPGR